MNTYEITFHLESGYDLNMLVAAGTAETAKKQAHIILGTACEPKGVGDVMKFNWRFDEITVRQVIVAPTAHDFWQPDAAHAERNTLTA